MRHFVLLAAGLLALGLTIAPGAQAHAVAIEDGQSEDTPVGVGCPHSGKCCVYFKGGEFFCQQFEAAGLASDVAAGPPAGVDCPDTSKCCVYVLSRTLHCQDFEARALHGA